MERAIDWGGSVEFASAGAVFGLVKEGVEGGAVEELAVEPDGSDLRGVADVGKGIGGEQDEVGALSGGDTAEVIGAAEEFGGAKGCSLQRSNGCETGFDKQC